jgi:hypothetical protein
VNAYDELAGYRFAPGRDYDKRSVETFRARVLNLVDELLNQITQLHDEVVDLRDRTRPVPPEPVVDAIDAPVVPTSWLDELAEHAASEQADDDPTPTIVAAPVPPPAFPAPPVATWLAALEGLDDTPDEDDDDRAGSTAELLLAAAGNAVAVQAAAAAGARPEPDDEAGASAGIGAPGALAPLAFAAEPSPAARRDTPAHAVVPPPPPRPAGPPPPPWTRVADPVDGPVRESPRRTHDRAARNGAPPAPPAATRPPAAPAPGTREEPAAATLRVQPGADVVDNQGAVRPLPIVLDDGLPEDAALPSPVRHWGGWMR